MQPFSEAFFFLLAGSVFGVGLYLRSRRRNRDLERLTRELEAESQRHASFAVAEERARIARDLHDLVAHNVGATVMQAQAAEELMAVHPDRAADSLHTIQRLSREALQEMRRMVAVMRTETSDAVPPPQPKLANVIALISAARTAGLRTELIVEGEPRPLPPGLETSAYRIVQEALANARKHAGDGARVTVTVRYRDDVLDLEVRDDGRGVDSTTDALGHGLIAMRERVAFFGGVFTAESLGAAGFLVRASLPLPATTT